MLSMTAFARSNFDLNGIQYSLEIRTVNSRYREVSLRLPPPLNAVEDRVRQSVSQHVTRGRVQLSCSRESAGNQEMDVEVNTGLAHKYYDVLVQLKNDLSLSGDIDISLMMGVSDLFTVTRPKMDEEELWAKLSPGLEEALLSLVEMRALEGNTLKQDITERLDLLRETLASIEPLKDKMVDDYVARVKERARVLLNGLEVDEQRLLMEIAIMAERSDITEELVRARSHLDQFRQVLETREPVGRKMDFLVQEINREVNTIGSKANNAEIAQIVVTMKSELEKIREQIQNIE